jgi:hypothetical protein
MFVEKKDTEKKRERISYSISNTGSAFIVRRNASSFSTEISGNIM